MLYRNLSGYFREKYGKRLSKICIDGGFSCPNRDGTVGVGGCIYCGERGAGEHITGGDITSQVRRALDAAKEGEEFVAYFQNFTNTYAELSVLRERYDAALIDERIRVLAIGTRPDCISPEVCELIASYSDRVDVWVELGLQTANDRTAEIINRGYKTEVFDKAVKLLSEYSIPVVVHLIVGLPTEGREEIEETARHLSAMPIWGIKIHSIYVSRGTRLAEMYASREYEPPTEDEYLQSVIYILTHISPKTVVHRLTGDCPEGQLIAPEWNRNKHALIEKIHEEMKSRGLRQGCLYNSD